MKRVLYKIFLPLFNLIGLGGVVKIYLGSLREDGWFISYETKQSIDADGNPLPWYSYAAIKFLEPRLNTDMYIYEYGSGNSTLWYSKRVKTVDSIEHDRKWFFHVKKSMPDNVNIICEEDPIKYANDIRSRGIKYDIVVVDGIERFLCAKAAIECIKNNGVIILDNANKPKHAEAKAFLDNSNLKNIEFCSLAPVGARNDNTIIYYNSDNVLGI